MSHINPYASFVPALPPSVPTNKEDWLPYYRWCRKGVRGWIFFSSTPAHIQQWRETLCDWGGFQPTFFLDSERGSGTLITGQSILPDPLLLASFPSSMAYRYGQWLARDAHAIGIDRILGPVADIASNPYNPIINIRASAKEPHTAAERVCAQIKGIQEILPACVKHFPGHGKTYLDSHSARAIVHSSEDEWKNSDAIPFLEACSQHVWGVMIGHLHYPGLDPIDRPATFSPRIIRDLLKHEMGFSGVIITDALMMAGAGTENANSSAVSALKAGCDLILMPVDIDGAMDALDKAILAGEISYDDCVSRLSHAFSTWPATTTNHLSTIQDSQSLSIPESAHLLSKDMASTTLTVYGEWPIYRDNLDIIVWGDKVNHWRHLPLMNALPHRDIACFFGQGATEALLQRVSFNNNPQQTRLLAIFSSPAGWAQPLSLSLNVLAEKNNLVIVIFGNADPFFLPNPDNTQPEADSSTTDAQRGAETPLPCAFFYTDHPEAQRSFSNWWLQLSIDRGG